MVEDERGWSQPGTGAPGRDGAPTSIVVLSQFWRALAALMMECRALTPHTRFFMEGLCARAFAGERRDVDVAWLHASKQRACKPREI